MNEQCSTLQHIATHCNTLQHTATRCNTLQHKQKHMVYVEIADTRVSFFLMSNATHCSTLQHTAAHYNTLQHTATHCITLQHNILYTQKLQIQSFRMSNAAPCNTQSTRRLLQCVALSNVMAQHTATHNPHDHLLQCVTLRHVMTQHTATHNPHAHLSPHDISLSSVIGKTNHQQIAAKEFSTSHAGEGARATHCNTNPHMKLLPSTNFLERTDGFFTL